MLRLPLLALAALFVAVTSSRAADPLDCIPPSAQVIVVSDSPRKLAEAVAGLEAFQKVQKLPQYSTVYNSIVVRRGMQLLAMFEKQLGAKWPELLDQIAGDGVAFGFQFAPDPAPAILVVQGRDAEQVKKASELALKTISEQSPDAVKRIEIANCDAVKIGDLFAARTGATTIISNNEDMLRTSVQAATTDRAKSPLHKARRDTFQLLPKDPLAWLWLDFASLKQSKATKDFFDATRKDFVQTLAGGGTIDCVRRSDFVAAGLYKEPTGFRLSLRLPAGRSEFPPEYQLHVPPKDKPGSLPILTPPGTLYSQSFHLDIGFLWKNRDKLLNDEIRTGLEKADKDISKVLPGNARFGELLGMWGPYHRIVVANHDTPPYKKQPEQRFPAFAYVASGGDPKFAKAVEPAIRSAAIVGSLQFGLKMTELTHDGVKIVAYRFPENKELASDPTGIRFNFEPCFAIVDDQLVVASTVELCKKVLAELKRVEKQPGSNAVLRSFVSAKGVAEILAAQSDALVTEGILSRGVGLEEARKEVANLVAWVKTLGTVRLEIDIAEKQYKLDLVWDLASEQR